MLLISTPSQYFDSDLCFFCMLTLFETPNLSPKATFSCFTFIIFVLNHNLNFFFQHSLVHPLRQVAHYLGICRVMNLSNFNVPHQLVNEWQDKKKNFTASNIKCFRPAEDKILNRSSIQYLWSYLKMLKILRNSFTSVLPSVDLRLKMQFKSEVSVVNVRYFHETADIFLIEGTCSVCKKRASVCVYGKIPRLVLHMRAGDVSVVKYNTSSHCVRVFDRLPTRFTGGSVS